MYIRKVGEIHLISHQNFPPFPEYLSPSRSPPPDPISSLSLAPSISLSLSLSLSLDRAQAMGGTRRQAAAREAAAGDACGVRWQAAAREAAAGGLKEGEHPFLLYALSPSLFPPLALASTTN